VEKDMAVLVVRVIKKYYDKDDKLLGYEIMSKAGEKRSVYKDQLKNAIANGQVVCENMTFTSDGRLIGRASVKPVERKAKNPGQQKSVPIQTVAVKAIITNGRKIGGALLDVAPSTQYKEFETGLNAEASIKSGRYSNISIVNGKPDFNNVKKISYSKIKPKLIRILADNGINPSFDVQKFGSDESNKYGYNITVDTTNGLNVIRLLVENEMILAKNKVLGFDGNCIKVECITGIKDVRKVVKGIKIG